MRGDHLRSGAIYLGGGLLSDPGSELGYDQITSDVSITGTTEGTATTLITCAAHTFDGAPVIVEFFAGAAAADPSTDATITIGLFESGSLVNRFGQLKNPNVSFDTVRIPFMGKMRVTPSVGSHSYVVKAWVSGGTSTVSAGTGGAGNNPPAWVRFTKV